MSHKATNWAFEQQHLSPAEKLVLIAICDHVFADGTCCPSQEQLARKSNCSVRTVRRHLQTLEELHLITRDPRTSEAYNGGRLTDMYRIALDETAERSPAKLSGGSPAKLSGPPGQQCPVATDVPSRKEQVRASARTTETYPADFEAFWTAYPNKTDKRAAFLTWKARIKAGADPDRILVGARTYAEDCRALGTEKRFIKHPKTWLNAESWNNAPVAPSGASAAEPQLRLDPPAEFLARLSDEGVSDQEYSRQVQQWRRDEMARRGWVA